MFQERNTLIAELLTGTLENCRIGVIAQAFPEINIATVVNTIRKKLDRNLYVSVVGYEIENQQLNGITIETTIEKSIEWRNKRQYSRSILVFVRGDVSKLHSLREFDTVTSRDLSLFLLKKAEYLSDNDPQKAFWKAMQNEAATFPLAMVEKFVDAVHRQRKDMDAIPNNLWHLGLLRDEQILSRIQKPSERLRRNLAIIEEMGQLSQNSRRRMGAVLSRARGKQQIELRQAYHLLMDFFSRGELDSLKQLNLATVEELIRSSRPSPEKTTSDQQNGLSHENDQNNNSTIRVLKGRALQESIADYFVKNDPEAIQELQEFASQLGEFYTNPQKTSDGMMLNNQSIRLERPMSGLRELISWACSEIHWGATLESSRFDLRDAIKNASHENVHPYNPNDSSQGLGGQTLFSLLRKFDAYIGNHSFSDALKRLTDARSQLLVYIDLLMNYNRYCGHTEKFVYSRNYGGVPWRLSSERSMTLHSRQELSN